MSRPAVQRWRIVYRRQGGAANLSARDEAAAWEAVLRASGLPVAMGDQPTGRPRLQLGPPVSGGIVALEELIDVFMAERVTMAGVREALAQAVGQDRQLIDLADVWIGAPSLPATVVGAEYRVVIDDGDLMTDVPALAEAIARLVAAPRLERDRERGERTTTYDLRPLIDDVHVDTTSRLPTLVMRLRIDQQAGSGRPGDVLEALQDVWGRPLQSVEPIVRTRVFLSPG